MHNKRIAIAAVSVLIVFVAVCIIVAASPALTSTLMEAIRSMHTIPQH